MELFRFRLNCVDYYQTSPTDFDPDICHSSAQSQHHRDPIQVPIIRAFGATETGQKVCAHIHGALPYLYLEYGGSLEDETVDSYVHSLRASIDHALALSYRYNPYDNPRRIAYVGHITLVKGVPFYGYHVGYKYFLKVYMLNPANMTRFVDLLHQGAIMKQTFQPYEAHIPYLLQWMCDFNLYGCDFVDCEKVMFRAPVPLFNELKNMAHKWHNQSIESEWISDPESYQRQSHCSIEIDVHVQDIANRRVVKQRLIHRDIIERFGQQGPEDKVVHSMAGLWKDETIRRKRRMGIENPSSTPFAEDAFVSMSSDPRRTGKGDWVHEEEYRNLVDELVRKEQENSNGPKPSFDDFVKRLDPENKIKTAFESIEDLFPANLARRGLDPDDDDGVEDAVVDESRISVPQNADGIFTENLPGEQRSDGETWPLGERQTMSSEGTSSDPHDVEEMMLASPRKRRKVSSESFSSIQRALVASGITKPVTLEERRVPFKDSTRMDDLLPDESNFGSSNLPSTQSSQTTIKAHANRDSKTVAFPVVKNANVPALSTSASQTSSQISSQKVEVAGYASSHQNTSTNTRSVASRSSGWGHSASKANLRQEITDQAWDLARNYRTAFPWGSQSSLYYAHLPPTAEHVGSTMLDHGLPQVIYQDAYYSDENDVPETSREYAGREFRFDSLSVPFLPDFDPTGLSPASYGEKPPAVVDEIRREVEHNERRQSCSLMVWEFANIPPSAEEVEQWLEEGRKTGRLKACQNDLSKPAKRDLPMQRSQIEEPTQQKSNGPQNVRRKTSVSLEAQYMSIMSLEVHVNTRDTFVPNPEHDEVACIFWCIKDDVPPETGYDRDELKVGVLALSDSSGIAQKISRQCNALVEYEEDELDLINRMIDIVREHDPDILTGYEVHNGSWGYLIERSRIKFEYNLAEELSRTKSKSHGRFGKNADRWGFQHTSTIRITGRHMINIWRAMQSELNLLQYTMENVVFHLLRKRIPHYSFPDLTKWYRSHNPRHLAKTVDYFLSRVQLNIRILDANEIISRTSEQARVIGVDFFSVISRGSQFKVESLMFRIAKPENFILVSPSRKQVGEQNALECLPLVMEPQSDFYNSPLLVLDFQSLYPSVMIAYNYCYSTFLGRVVSWRGRNKMGFTDYERQPGFLEMVKEHINIAPNGIMYVRPELRKSLLAKMLIDVLETRVMVKNGMKDDKEDKILQALLNNRQLALKLIANVTYGYASASFSGRMPCSEIADSIVQTGRETLEKAIALIHSDERWGAEVVYGDTDSLFVYLKGKTKDEAFNIGQEIANAVTKANPKPVKLKFEKVYLPSVLLAKKRYVGFKYESRDQTEPEFDAKGIETVRRDGTPAVQKIEEKALKILFRTADLSQVKEYFQRQCMKIMTGRISIQDFLFAREVRLGTYSDKGPPPPGALIAARRMLEDPRTEPQYGERVPYIVVSGAPGARLIDRCVAPETLLEDGNYELDTEYYISKNLIPPLERIFNLVGANVRQWYDEMPKVQRVRTTSAIARAQVPGDGAAAAAAINASGALRKTLENYMKSTSCLVCHGGLPAPTMVQQQDEPAPTLPVCESCASRPDLASLALRTRIHNSEARTLDISTVCRSCSGLAPEEEVRCDSRDCPVFYSRVREKARLRSFQSGMKPVIDALEKVELDVDDDLEW
ncbi:hypothetical protein BDY21DRAFT_280750 [Lineolata rhizophorae]|uniref:DNA polymerase n=1 Tax=Lineolata rhizophorae TaxID=578093 RepID=A0A6A6P9C1_9PEZI|nr:hypothetical protein BDY21DRAFT_280750 [Lineolata rhizophorae]